MGLTQKTGNALKIMTNTLNTHANKAQWAVVFTMVLGLLLMVMPDMALAQVSTAACATDSVLAKALNNLVALLNGPVARALAVLAVVGFGVAALTGKVEWSRAMIVVLGIGIVFSAKTLMDLMTGGTTSCVGAF